MRSVLEYQERRRKRKKIQRKKLGTGNAKKDFSVPMKITAPEASRDRKLVNKSKNGANWAELSHDRPRGFDANQICLRSKTIRIENLIGSFFTGSLSLS